MLNGWFTLLLIVLFKHLHCLGANCSAQLASHQRVEAHFLVCSDTEGNDEITTDIICEIEQISMKISRWKKSTTNCRKII